MANLKTTKLNTLSKIKYEELHKDRLSTNFIDDVQAAKELCDNLCFKINENGIDGFIREIQLDPFGFLLISDIQVYDKLTYIN